MFLSSIQPAEGATRARRHVGRGIGSGLDKTGDRGHEGQRSRSDGFYKVGSEDGQILLQRRLPKRGFRSLITAANAEICLSELNLFAVNEIDILVLKRAGSISTAVSSIKVITSDELSKAIVLKDIKVTKDARVAIETTGDKVEE